MLSGGGGDFERGDSRKRRRLSERRRVFSRIGLNYRPSESQSRGSLSTEPSSWSSASAGGQVPSAEHGALHSQTSEPSPLRSDSPLGGDGKISMKIQIHITVAPENEPLILADTQMSNLLLAQQETKTTLPQTTRRKKSDSISIGEHIHERLSRQNTLSTRRRQQLLALHQQPALEPAQQVAGVKSEADLSSSRADQTAGRDQGGRSSTITGGVGCDEATARFLASYTKATATAGATTGASREQLDASREHIYFKRDGQRFGHEFTLKLAVDRTYRCLLKVRPLLPLQAISIQGHHVLFADCSQHATVGHGPASAPASSTALSTSWHSGGQQHQQQQQHSPTYRTNHTRNNHHRQASRSAAGAGASHRHQLSHALTTGNLHSALAHRQQSQMLRHFAQAASNSSHLGSQLNYMFDWSANRFQVNKNKNRTEVQTVLKFANGQILSLPLQVKFYQSECRQHLNWGSQLHFIDFDCQINDMGQMSVDRVHYY